MLILLLLLLMMMMTMMMTAVISMTHLLDRHDHQALINRTRQDVIYQLMSLAWLRAHDSTVHTHKNDIKSLISVEPEIKFENSTRFCAGYTTS